MMDGTGLAARYAFPPNRRGYCGGAGFIRTLKAFLGRKTPASALRRELMGFRAHYAYLSLIARENGLEPFDADVVRAFWTGNRLLEAVRPEAMRGFVRSDLFAGRQARRAERLCENLPEGILPHHSFNVLYVNFVSNAVPRSIRNFDSCCITRGRVVSVSGETAVIDRDSIAYENGFAIARRRSRASLSRGGVRLVGKLRKGDAVAVHWGMVVERLSPGNERLLGKYTIKNLRAINESGKAQGGQA